MSETKSPPPLGALPAAWRARAAELEQLAAGAQATAMRWCAAQLDEALRVAGEEPLTLEQAARESGYSAEHLRRLIADGTLPQAGRKGAPRVRRRDLPRRAPRSGAGGPASAAGGGSVGYSVDRDALEILQRVKHPDRRSA